MTLVRTRDKLMAEHPISAVVTEKILKQFSGVNPPEIVQGETPRSSSDSLCWIPSKIGSMVTKDELTA